MRVSSRGPPPLVLALLLTSLHDPACLRNFLQFSIWQRRKREKECLQTPGLVSVRLYTLLACAKYHPMMKTLLQSGTQSA